MLRDFLRGIAGSIFAVLLIAFCVFMLVVFWLG
jgi:hypothetical protein